MTDRKALILKLYNERYSYTDIAKIIGVSKQRIHQIITDYTTQPNRSIDNIRYFSNKCAICKKETTIIHHIDTDSLNNNPKNLLSVCEKCHKKIHAKIDKPVVTTKRRGKWSTKYDRCIKCSTTTIPYLASGLCKSCYFKRHN